jgi:hypothetical protein
VAKLGSIRGRYKGKLDVKPKNVSDQAMNLVLANGACLALNELEKEIQRLHLIALSEE